MLTEEMKKLVRGKRLGFIATVCSDGTPNLSPKGTTDVWDDEHLIFADICSPQTVANLRENPAIEINVVDPFVRKGFRFKGTASIVENGEIFDKAIKFYRERGAAGKIKAIIFVKVKLAFPLISPVYETGASENEVRRRWMKRRKVIENSDEI